MKSERPNGGGKNLDTALMLFRAGAFDRDSGVTRANLFQGVTIAKETAASRLRALQWEGFAGRYSYSPTKVVWWLSSRGIAFVLKDNRTPE